jgi:hypothetical protein
MNFEKNKKWFLNLFIDFLCILILIVFCFIALFILFLFLSIPTMPILFLWNIVGIDLMNMPFKPISFWQSLALFYTMFFLYSIFSKK